jgi:hypothetical protein
MIHSPPTSTTLLRLPKARLPGPPTWPWAPVLVNDTRVRTHNMDNSLHNFVAKIQVINSHIADARLPQFLAGISACDVMAGQGERPWVPHPFER